jgi:hypothetical protein
VKKYLSMLIIAIMAVSVLSAAGVITTQKAVGLRVPTPIVIQYQPGAKFNYAPTQFNGDWAGPQVGPGIKHFEAATGGAAYSSIRTNQMQTGASIAQVGMYWQLTLPSGAPYNDWNYVKTLPCKVTVTVSYHIVAKGDQNTEADANWGPRLVSNFYAYYAQDSIHGNDPVHAKNAIVTTTWQGTVGDVFDPIAGIYGQAGAQAVSYSEDIGQASAAIVCTSIVLEFPAS